MSFIPNKQYNEGDDISVTPTGDVTLARDPDGKAAPLQVDVDGNVKVTGGSSDATAAKQDVGNASLASIDGKLTGPVPVSGPLTNTQLRASAVPVSAASLPLPSGAATETTLSAIKTKTDNLDVLLSSVSGGQQYDTGDTIAGVSVVVKGTIPMVVDVAAADGSATPMTSFGSDGGDPQIVAGAGLLGWLVTIVTKLRDLNTRFTTPIQVTPTHVGTSGDPFSVAVEEGYDTDSPIQYPLVLKAGTGQKELMVSVEESVLPTGAATETTLAAILAATGSGGLTDTQLRASPVPVSGPLTDTQLRAAAVPVSATSLPLPSGAATAANQTTGNTSLSNIDTGIGTDGATPPVIPGTGVRGWLRSIYDKLSASIAVTGTFWQATQPVSAAALPLPSGASTEATLALIKAKTDNIDVALSTRTKPADAQHVIIDSSASIAVTGPLTDTQLRASAVPVSAASLPLPSGAATSAAQTTAQTSLSNIDTGIGTDGAAPPSIPGTGVRGWLRSIYDTLVAGIITLAARNSGTASWTSGTTAGASGANVTVTATGYQSVRLALNNSVGGITGTVVLEGSMDGGTTFPWPVNTVMDNSSALGIISTGGIITFANAFVTGAGSSLIGNCSGFTHVRVRLSVAINTGTVTVYLAATNSSPTNQIPGGVYVENPSNLPVPVTGTLAAVTTVSTVSTVSAARVVGNGGNTTDGVIGAATAPLNAFAQLVVAQTTAPSLTAGQSCAQQADYQGSKFVKPFRRGQTGYTPLTIANDSTSKTLVAAQAAGIFADLVTFICTVAPAATTPISFTITISDGTQSIILDMDTGSLTTGTPVPIIIPFNPALKAATAATAWTVQLSVNTVTVHITTEFVLQKAS